MTTGIGALSDLLPKQTRGGRIYGIVVGVVSSVDDPNKQGRVQVQFPWLPNGVDGAAVASPWARVVAPMAGASKGLYLPLLVGDEVAMMFEHGDPNHPFILGALWNGKDAAPGPAPTNDAVLYVLKSKSGHTITLDDTNGKEKITIVDKGGDNQITFDAKANTVTIATGKDMTLSAKGNISLSAPDGDVTLTCNNFKVTAKQGYAIATDMKGQVTAQQELDLTCMAGVKINTDGLVVT